MTRTEMEGKMSILFLATALLHVGVLGGPPLCFRLTFRNTFWVDCRDILYRYSSPDSQRMNPTYFYDALSCLPQISIFSITLVYDNSNREHGKHFTYCCIKKSLLSPLKISWDFAKLLPFLCVLWQIKSHSNLTFLKRFYLVLEWFSTFQLTGQLKLWVLQHR